MRTILNFKKGYLNVLSLNFSDLYGCNADAISTLVCQYIVSHTSISENRTQSRKNRLVILKTLIQGPGSCTASLKSIRSEDFGI
jgi:hypothetical protein